MSGAYQFICINESAGYGVVISASEIIKSRFGIKVVASIAERIKSTNTIGVKSDRMIAPSVVFIISFAKSLVNRFRGDENHPRECGGGKEEIE